MRDVVLGMSAPDYFELFSLEPRLSLDLADLEQRFYRLSRQLHPDRFARATPAARAKAEEATAALNDAYRTLRDPILRAQWMLRREGFEAADGRKVPSELLNEVFEIREALDEVRSGDRSPLPRLKTAREHMLAALAECNARLEHLFQEYDRAPGKPVLARIRECLDRRKYISTLVTQIESELVSE